MSSNFDKEFHKKLGLKIKQIRKAKKLTQESLSLMIGADNSYVAIIENAHRDIPLSKIHKLAKALGVDVKELFDFNGL